MITRDFFRLVTNLSEYCELFIQLGVWSGPVEIRGIAVTLKRKIGLLCPQKGKFHSIIILYQCLSECMNSNICMLFRDFGSGSGIVKTISSRLCLTLNRYQKRKMCFVVHRIRIWIPILVLTLDLDP